MKSSQNNHSPASSRDWIGRFAPSPTGHLHRGSLVAAVASYLIAKQNNGIWLLRIEDIDKPREVPGSVESICSSLKRFGLEWDGEVFYQSQRHAIYQKYLDELLALRRVYACDCSRKMIQARNGGIYDGFCAERQLAQTKTRALRATFDHRFAEINDALLGRRCFNHSIDQQDFVVKRADGLFAYQLVVVADDIEQGVDHVVRGQDIIDSTPRQNLLYHYFNRRPPEYFHLPLVMQDQSDYPLIDGDNHNKIFAAENNKLNSAETEHSTTSNRVKMSKHLGDRLLGSENPTRELLAALKFLGQKVEPQMNSASPKELLQHFIKAWDNQLIYAKDSLLQPVSKND